MYPFATGQMVQLKSGGPLMLVEDVSSNELLCAWFAKRQMHRISFDKANVSHTYDSALFNQKHRSRMRSKLVVIENTA